MTTSRFNRLNRRQLFASSALGSAAVLSSGRLLPAGRQASAPAALAQNSSSDVPMFRGNPARTGEMPGPGPDDSNGVEVIWTFATGGEIVSSPAVVDGVIYVGSADGRVYAVDAVDGAERWAFATDDAINSSPAGGDGVVYVGSDDGELYAINADEGTERWRFSTGEMVFSSPALMEETVYVGSDDGNLYAVNADDGSERWRFTTGDEIRSSPAVVDGVVCVGSYDGYLYALNAEDGTELWRFATGDRIVSSPAMVGGLIYVMPQDLRSQEGNQLIAVNAEDGTERWRFAIEPWSLSSPAVVDDVVYVTSGDPQNLAGNQLIAVNAGDGTERWRFMADSSILSSPAVVGAVVYIASSGRSATAGGGDIRMVGTGTFFALNAADGTERWAIVPGGQIVSSPAVVDGVICVGSDDGNLYAIGARVPKLSIGGIARVTEKTSLRGGPAPSAVERVVLDADTVVTITGESVTTGDAAWWPVPVDETGDQGWVEASKLEPLTSGPTPTPEVIPTA